MNNPTGVEYPEEYHPDGSNSEQIVAGERSTFDPLAERLKKNGGSFRGKLPAGSEDEPREREMSAPLCDVPDAEDTNVQDTMHRSGP